MKRALPVMLASLAIVAVAAERNWQTGTWGEVKVTRPRVVIGVQSAPSRPGTRTPAMTEIRTYVIDTDELRLELKEPAPAPRRPVDAMVGERVTFALEKNAVYVREADGTEVRLQVTKRIKK
jgi:hypothetical protein